MTRPKKESSIKCVVCGQPATHLEHVSDHEVKAYCQKCKPASK